MIRFLRNSVIFLSLPPEAFSFFLSLGQKLNGYFISFWIYLFQLNFVWTKLLVLHYLKLSYC